MSARHLVPRVESIAESPSEVWDLYLDGYDTAGLELVYRTALDVRHGAASGRSVRHLGHQGDARGIRLCAAFDPYFKKGLGVSTFSKGSLGLVAEFYRENAAIIDGLREPTLAFTTDQPTARLYTRAKIVDMIFFIEGGYPSATSSGSAPPQDIDPAGIGPSS